jgi:uncharacterized protein involved in response to NO
MTDFAAIEKDPFRIFFPLGIILAVMGLIPWTKIFWGSPVYPLALHKALMMNGFLLAFVAGFLMTAIPRFAQSNYASWREISISVGGLIAGAMALAFNFYAFHFMAAAGTLGALIVFSAKRFRTRQSNPPPTFILVGSGLLFWLLANLTLAVAELKPHHVSYIRHIADDIFTHGALLSLILGIGSRLIPGILGWTKIEPTPRHDNQHPKPFLQNVPKDVWLGTLLFWLSYLAGSELGSRPAIGVRFVIVLYFAVRFWRIHRFPQHRNYLTWNIWLSAYCLCLGLGLQFFWLSGSAHALHLILIGGFSLLTITVASRVTLAHSQEGTAAEGSAKFLSLIAILLLVATFARVPAILITDSYLQHLGYAALLMILALILWLTKFFKNLVSPFLN